jgi:hypothetical protein
MLLGAAAKRQRVEAECLAIGHCTKSTLANILRTLHARGVLRDDIGEGSTRQVRSRLRATLEHHSKAMTPYGRVVQRLSLPFPKDVLPTWDIAHPFALLYHMSTLSRRFGVLMENAMGGKCEPIPIVLYIDEASNLLDHIGVAAVHPKANRSLVYFCCLAVAHCCATTRWDCSIIPYSAQSVYA